MSAQRTALITGVAGQDGVLLARHLLTLGYGVVGTVLPGPTPPTCVYLDGVTVVEHDVRDTDGFERLLVEHGPDEVYNLAGFTSVGASWDEEDLVMEVNAHAVERMLAVLARHDARLLQPSSAEVFGEGDGRARDESSEHRPRSPYAVSKSQAHRAAVRARDDGIFASVVVLHNHESPLRPQAFVTRKITRAVAEIAEGRRDTVTLGNLETARDWGAARDVVVAMHATLQTGEPADYVVATGRLHRLEDLLTTAFGCIGVDDPWPHVRQDPALLRPADVVGSPGDPRRALQELGWSPTVTFEDVVRDMVDVDRRRLASGVEEEPSYLSADGLA